MSICGQTAGWTKMRLGTEVDHDPGDIVFDGDQLLQRATATNFGSYLLWICGQTAGYIGIRIPIDTEAGLGPGDIVLDGDWGPMQLQSPSKRHRRQFSAHVYSGQTVTHLSYC